jgi:glutaconyl-CoA decarboxylase
LAATKPAAKSAASEKPAPAPTVDGGFTVKAPMPGSVLDVKVSVGDQAAEGDVLVVLEAMKMENELTAPQAGTVKQVLVKKGDTVNSGDPLIILS